jgi:acetylornithine deacetylase
MDTLTAVAFARELIDIDSTTGQEADAGRWLASRLRGLGYTVVEQPVAGDRFNVFATLEVPDVVLSTHYDCVPPFFPSREADGVLYGRGACDAKGILAAQVAAAERLRATGDSRVGLLFVVGEERGSEGATVANQSPPGSCFLVNGEPTDSMLATGTRGILRVRLHAQGRAGHSSAPQHFESGCEACRCPPIRYSGPPPTAWAWSAGAWLRTSFPPRRRRRSCSGSSVTRTTCSPS